MFLFLSFFPLTCFFFLFPQGINKCYPFIRIDYLRFEIFNFLRYPNFPRSPTTSKGFRRFPKITEDFRRFPSIAEDDPMTSDHTNCFDKLTSEFTFNWSMSKNLHLSVRREKLVRMRDIRILDRQA